MLEQYTVSDAAKEFINREMPASLYIAEADLEDARAIIKELLAQKEALEAKMAGASAVLSKWKPYEGEEK